MYRGPQTKSAPEGADSLQFLTDYWRGAGAVGQGVVWSAAAGVDAVEVAGAAETRGFGAGFLRATGAGLRAEGGAGVNSTVTGFGLKLGAPTPVTISSCSDSV